MEDYKEDPRQYVENHRDELPDTAVEAMKQYIDDAEIDDSSIYGNLSRLKRCFDRGFVPDGFDLGNPTIEELETLFSRINTTNEISSGTKFTYRKSIKSFYRAYKKDTVSRADQYKQLQDSNMPVPTTGKSDFGPHYPKTTLFSATKDESSSVEVEEWMIMAPEEVRDIINQVQRSRERAYYWGEYSCAATSGEMHKLFVHDVDLEDESIYIRGNKEHQSQRMELLNEALSAFHDYLAWHPAVDDPYDTQDLRDEDGEPIPLWVKTQGLTCKRCDQYKSYHSDSDIETCESFTEKDWEPVGRRPFYDTWRDAVEASSVTRLEKQDDGTTITEEELKMKHLRKSMLTRFAAQIDEGVKEAQLREFARWKPNAGAPGHYIAISEEISRELVQQSFKGQPESEGGEKVVCRICETRNPADAIRCQRCQRSLDPAGSAQEQRYDELTNRLAALDAEALEAAISRAEEEDRTKQLEARIERLEDQLRDEA